LGLVDRGSVNTQHKKPTKSVYARSPGNRLHWQNSPFFPPMVATTRFAYPRRDGQVELAWVVD